MSRRSSSPDLRVAAQEAVAAPDREDLLVERAQQGDVEAWSRLYQESFDRVHRHVYYLTGDPALAEDLVQEAYARAMVTVSGFDRRSPFLTWMRGVALNVVRMHWRRNKTKKKVHGQIQDMQDDQAAPLPEEQHLQDQRIRHLYDALGELPEPLREAFVLRELEGLSTRDAAEQVGISANNLAVRASRARASIREALRRRGCLDPTEASP